jgi:uncharacterized membrane protein
MLVGVGAGGFVDEVVFHQFLHWHHFWDGGTQGAALASDGFLHAVVWTSIVAGLFWFADLRRREWRPAPWLGGVLLGAGGFQLFDGLVDHKLLRLHQVRYGVPLWPYDLAWDVPGVVLLLAGAGLLLRSRRTAAR